MTLKALSLVAALLVLNGCVTTRSELRGEGGNQDLQRQTNAQRRSNQPPPPPAPKEDEVATQMRDLNGRVDGVENQVQQLAQTQASEKESVTKMAQAIDQKFLTYEEAVKKLEERVTVLTEQVAQLQQAKASAPAASAAGGGSKATAYEEAEELYAAKKWKDAIVAYQKYRDQNPKGKLYADATYKIGLCFQELKMKDEARAFFDEVTAKFPRSKEAKKAQFRAKQLK